MVEKFNAQGGKTVGWPKRGERLDWAAHALYRQSQMAKSKSKHKTGVGCGYVIGLGVLICCLLWFNSWLAELFVQSNQDTLGSKNIGQTIRFLFPVLFIFVEFWLYDRLVNCIYSE